MDERVIDHLKRLNQYRLRLLELKQLTLQEFLKDDMRQAAIERLLHLAIESCLNIGNPIVSLSQFEKPVATPETYADVFKALYQLGAVEEDFLLRLRLIHY
jgi:uncharacterized protein YutE (UPF0331/DUF86 family)